MPSVSIKSSIPAGDSKLCFRPLRPRMEMGVHVVWKKYQMFSKAADQYLVFLKNYPWTNPRAYKPKGQRCGFYRTVVP